MTGGGEGSRLAIRSTSDNRPKPVSTTVAPFSWASFATENAIDASVMTPVTSSRLPASNPDNLSSTSGDGWRSVAHSEAAVDGDDRSGDVRRAVAREEHRGGRDLVGMGQAPRRHRFDDLRFPSL